MSNASLASTGAVRPHLDDLMLAMDVVDTLRHDQRLVERELSAASNDAALINRLREIYTSQGIEVPDRILEEGVKALHERRFSYDPPGPGLARSLALLWIARGRIGKALVGIAAALFAVGLAYDVFIARPERVAIREAQVELAEVLPARLEDLYGNINREAKVEAARENAAKLLADGKAALARKDASAAREAADAMQALYDDLRAEYTLRIVNRPGEASGVWREPMINRLARNDYLVVEAIAPNGKALMRPILNEETGTVTAVSKWGVRVSNDVFERVMADKRDNGIIEKNIVGHKKRGYLDIDYAMPVLGGTITKW
jgi:hypothetical protein